MGWPFTGKDGLLANVYIPILERDGEKAISRMMNNWLARKSFLSGYRTDILPMIETFPEEVERAKKYVAENFPDKEGEEKSDTEKIVLFIQLVVL